MKSGKNRLLDLAEKWMDGYLDNRRRQLTLQEQRLQWEKQQYEFFKPLLGHFGSIPFSNFIWKKTMLNYPPQGIETGAVRLIKADWSNVTLADDTADNTAKSVTISGGAMGANGIIIIRLQYKLGGTAGTKTTRIKLGGTTLLTVTHLASEDDAYVIEVWITNRNSQSSQISNITLLVAPDEAGTAGATAGTVINTSTVNTAIAQLLAITFQKANANDDIDLRGWTVVIIRST